MLNLSRRSRRRHWSAGYRSHASAMFLRFLAYEDDATCVRQFHPIVIPGLFQTEAYARELMVGMGRLDRTEIERRVQLRLARQHHFFGTANASQIVAVLDEAVLRRAVGGGEVMSEQIGHLIRMAALSEVNVSVIPASAGALAWPYGGLQRAGIWLRR